MAGPKIFIAHTVLIFQQNLTTLVRKDKIRCSGVLCSLPLAISIELLCRRLQTAI